VPESLTNLGSSPTSCFSRLNPIFLPEPLPERFYSAKIPSPQLQPRHDGIQVDELSVTAGVSLRMTCLCKNGQRRTMATFGVG
jgi:hypothetical protein